MSRSVGRPPKTFSTALGEMTLERAAYHCEACAAGLHPRDRALKLEDTSLSPAITRMVGPAAAMVTFAEGSELMRDLAGMPVDAKRVERTAEALGREIAADERSVVEPEPPVAPTVYLGKDGTGIPMRAADLEGRAGKQPDGSARTGEVKLVTVWTAEGRDDQGILVRDPGSVTHSAAIESAAALDTDDAPSEFARRADREAQRRGFDVPKCERRVVLGDGALRIWNLTGEQFPGAVEIVDFFDAKQHLSDVAKAIYGPANDVGRQWARQRHDELDDRQLDALCVALRVHAGANDEARKCLDFWERRSAVRPARPTEVMSQI